MEWKKSGSRPYKIIVGLALAKTAMRKELG